MAEMWFYTCEGKQMDPVSIKELKRLVGDGTLKPTDMIWKEGMPRWIRASSMKELFPDPTSALDQYFTGSGDKTGGQKFGQTSGLGMPGSKPAPALDESAAPKTVPSSADVEEPRTKRRRPVDDDDDRPSRPGGRPAGGSSVGIIIAMLLGGGVLLVALVVGIIILIAVSGQNPADPINNNNPGIDPNNLIKGPITYNVQLRHDQRVKRTFSFKKGADYEIIVKTQPNHPGIDVDLYIYDMQMREQIRDDDEKADCHKRWIPHQDGQYQVELHQFGGGVNVQCTVTIREVAPPPPEKKDPPVDPPLPVDVKKGKSSFRVDEMKSGQEQIYKFQVKAGHKARINVLVAKNPGIDFDLYVLKDTDGVQIAADTLPTSNPVVNFQVPATQVVRLRLHNKGTLPSRCTVFYDVGE